MNRLKSDQKNKVGKRKLEQDMEEDSREDMTGMVKLLRIGQDHDETSNYSSSSSQRLAQSLNYSQETCLRQFVAWTQAQDSVAISFLTKANWNIEYAMTLFFDNPHLFSGPPAPPAMDRAKVEGLFHQYLDKRDNVGERRMGPHGISRLLQDLGYAPTDRRVLILAWQLKAQTQCEFSLEEWVQGMEALRSDNINAIRQKIDTMNAEFDEDKKKTKFHELYNFTYQYGKPASCRSLDLETSVAYWDVLFGPRCPLMDQWIEFLVQQETNAFAKAQREMGDKAKRTKAVWITKDTWNLFFDFIVNSKPDLSDYDDEGAWPVMIDQFVEHCRANLGYPSANTMNDVQMDQPAYY